MGWNLSAPSFEKYSEIYWYGRSQQRNTEWMRPSGPASSDRVPASLRFSNIWNNPFRLNPDDGPHTIPSRHKSSDHEKESKEFTSSITSTAALHGNSTGAINANDLGPGTLSPAAVQTPNLTTLGFTSLKYVPKPVIVPEVPIPAHSTLISGNCLKICGPVHRTCAPQLSSFSYWFGLRISLDPRAIDRALWIPPRSSNGSGCEGPPKSVMSSPKNCIRRSLASLVLLLRNARTSSTPCITRAIMAMEITVEPELYSMTVLVEGVTLDWSMFIAASSLVSIECTFVIRRFFFFFFFFRIGGCGTRHGFDVVGWMHGHHLCIDADAILVEWVQMLRQLNQG